MNRDEAADDCLSIYGSVRTFNLFACPSMVRSRVQSPKGLDRQAMEISLGISRTEMRLPRQVREPSPNLTAISHVFFFSFPLLLHPVPDETEGMHCLCCAGL